MITVDCVQGSDEWFEARLGFVTASNFHKVLNKKTGRGAYMHKLAAERLTGFREASYKNDIMEYGNETEAEARRYYEIACDRKVEQVGFVMRDEDVGASPDGLVGEEGFIEIKCPLSSTHIETILSDKMPTKYIPQVQGLLWVTGRMWCNFISFDPKVLSRPMFLLRIERDEKYIDSLTGAVERFIEELKETVDKIQGDF